MRRRRNLLVAAAGAAALAAGFALWWWTHVGPRLDSACDGVRPAEGFQLASELPPDAERTRTSGQSEDVIDRLRRAVGPESGDAIYCGDFADPFVLWADGFYHAYATNTRGANVPVLRSIDGVHGREQGDALPELPEWSSSGRVWAPSVVERDGTYVLYYATHDDETGLQCISRSVGTGPEGPYSDSSARPLVCPAELGGAIDPSPFVDADGALYLLWKNDGNAVGVPSRLWSQRLSDDGLRVTGDPHELLAADRSWEGGVVEAPSMVEHDGVRYLFYSANAYDSPEYALGYATCTSAVGPCSKPDTGPWLAGTEHAQGPGGAEVFRDEAGDPWLVFHAWIAGDVGYPDGVRSLFAARLAFVDGVPVTET